MKIAIIGSKGIPATYGGVERHTEELAVGLAKRGYDVTVYSRKWYTQYDEEEYAGVKIKNIRSIKTKNLDTITHVFFSTLDAMKSDFDIIHYQGVGPALLSFIPRLFSRKTKTIVTFHCEDSKHEKWSRFAKIMLRLGEKAASCFPHKTITVSKLLKDKVRDIYNSEAEYIPNGINGKDLNTLQVDNNVLAKFGLEKGKYAVIVTRLIKHKGVHYAIEAYKQLSESIKNSYKLVIVGGSTFGSSYEKELKKLIKGESNIVMTGMQSGKDLETLFLGSKLFLNTSRAEGLAVSILEAMNYQKPVLVSDIPENLEIVGMNRGFTFKSANVDDLRLKLEFLLKDENIDLLQETSIIGKKFVEEEYAWKDIISKTENLYKNVLKGNTSKSPIKGIARV